jgi:hypothetical protein
MQMQVIQIASFLGFSPIITTASLHNTDLLKGFGATHVVDRRSDVASSIKEIMQSTPLTMVYDAVHTPISQAEVDLLSSGGKLLTMWYFPDDLDLSGDKHILGCFGTIWLHEEFGKGMYSKLQIFLEKGIIQVGDIFVTITSGMSASADIGSHSHLRLR